MAELRLLAQEISGQQKAPSTLRSYASDWKDFLAWCGRCGKRPLPASPDTLTLYLADSLRDRKVSTVERHSAAVRHYHVAAGHDSPTEDRTVIQLMRGARRKHGTKPAAKHAITPDQLRRMCHTQPKTDVGLRNQAILLLGFASGMRRSELSNLNIADIQISAKGMKVSIGRSKTDQEARGREIGIFHGSRVRTCPVRAMEKWLKIRGKKPGPLLTSLSPSRKTDQDRISDTTIWAIVKDAVTHIGLNPDLYGAHSLRAGCVTAAIEAGTPESLVMQRTGHKSIQTVARYVRPATLWARDPLAKAL